MYSSYTAAKIIPFCVAIILIFIDLTHIRFDYDEEKNDEIAKHSHKKFIRTFATDTTTTLNQIFYGLGPLNLWTYDADDANDVKWKKIVLPQKLTFFWFDYFCICFYLIKNQDDEICCRLI